MSRLKKSLGVNLDQVRIREFDMAGQKFKVRVPLSGEADGIYERTKEPDPNLVEIKYKEISDPILANKEVLENKDFVFTNDDIVVKNQSMRQLAKNKAQTELRILETFKLLVTTDGSSLDNLTYEEIAEDFPLPVQLSMVKKITDVISPNYEETRKN
jgi:hypothetical protein